MAWTKFLRALKALIYIIYERYFDGSFWSGENVGMFEYNYIRVK